METAKDPPLPASDWKLWLNGEWKNDSPEPRLLVILAHPDDEAIALGGRLHFLKECRFLCVTDGAPQDGSDARAQGFSTPFEYARARKLESQACLELAGISGDNFSHLKIQQDSGRQTQITDQEVPYVLPAIVRAIASELDRLRPSIVLTHPYEGGHPDHDGCAFAVREALRLHRSAATPLLLEAPFYHARHVWCASRRGIRTGRFLPNERSEANEAILFRLSRGQREMKRKLLNSYATQREVLTRFRTFHEEFRVAPTYDFDRPPHPGKLYYEELSWKMTSLAFCHLARLATNELHMGSFQPSLKSLRGQ